MGHEENSDSFLVNKLKDEYNVQINIDESGLVRLEGNKEDVAATEAELHQRIFKLENEKEKDVIIEQRHYRNIIGTKGDKIKEIRDKFNQVQIFFPGPGDRNDIVKVRGPKEDVDKCARYLDKLVKELNESSYQIEVPIYKQFHKFIIGKGWYMFFDLILHLIRNHYILHFKINKIFGYNGFLFDIKIKISVCVTKVQN